jgi:hypothetical protein
MENGTRNLQKYLEDLVFMFLWLIVILFTNKQFLKK